MIIDVDNPKQTKLDYHIVPMTDLKFIPIEHPATNEVDRKSINKSYRSRLGRNLANVELNGELLTSTERWWTSFSVLFGLSKPTFDYFDHAEVFNRVAAHDASNRHIRIVIERPHDRKPRLLSMSKPTSPIFTLDDAQRTVEMYGGKDLRYSNGVLSSYHTPRSGELTHLIGPDQFQNRYALEVPVDGYGLPSLYLMLFRLICQNGAVGYTKSFRTQINSGKDVSSAVALILDGFDSDEGYTGFRDRLLKAQNTPASIHESVSLYNMLVRLHDRHLYREGTKVGNLIGAFEKVTGDVARIYGTEGADAISARRQKILPTKASMYELINLATEISSHHCTLEGSRQLGAWFGNMVSEEYDLEDLGAVVQDFPDLYLESSREPKFEIFPMN